MARPRTIDRAQIVDAARQVFLEEGFSASTAAVARAAGVSEGSIFKRFGTKEALFVAAMGIEDLHLDLDGLERAGGDARTLLERIGLRLIRFFRDTMPRMMRLWAHCGPGHTPFSHMEDGEIPPQRFLRRVSDHLEAETRAGRLAAHNSQVAARMLIASMHSFVFFELVGAQAPGGQTPEDYVRGVVDTLWQGVAPQPTLAEDAR